LPERLLERSAAPGDARGRQGDLLTASYGNAGEVEPLEKTGIDTVQEARPSRLFPACRPATASGPEPPARLRAGSDFLRWWGRVDGELELLRQAVLAGPSRSARMSTSSPSFGAAGVGKSRLLSGVSWTKWM
jgi:hypothetical protein